MSRDPIVVGTDGSPTAMRAVDKAGELAQALDTPVHVVCAHAAIAAGVWPPRITGQQIVADAVERLKERRPPRKPISRRVMPPLSWPRWRTPRAPRCSSWATRE